MSGSGHGGRVGTGWKVRDSSGLVWPAMFPVRTDEMNLDHIAETAEVLRDVAGRVEDRTGQVAATWAGLQGCYSSPEAPAVWALMDPAQTQAEHVGGQLRRAADAVDDYVGELRGLRGKIDDVVGQCETFRAEVEGGVWRDAASTKEAGVRDYVKAGLSWTWVDERKVLVPWDQDQDQVDRNEQLVGLYSDVVAKVTAAAGRCANTIDGLPTLTGFAAMLAAGSPPAPGWSAGQVAASWGPPATEDRSWREQLGSSVYGAAQGTLSHVASLNGRDPSTGKWSFGAAVAARSAQSWDQADLGVSVIATFGLTAPLTVPAMGGRLTGHPEMGDWAPDWFQDRGTKTADTLAQLFGGDPSDEYVWQPWHDRPWQAGGTAAINVGTAVLPVKGLATLKGGGEATQAARTVEAAETGAMRAARNTAHPTLGPISQTSATRSALTRTITTTNPAKNVLATLDRIPDNLPRQVVDTRPRPVSDDLFSKSRPRTNPDPAPTPNHNPHPTPERAPQPVAATARAADHDLAPTHPQQAPGRAADIVTTQEIPGLPKSPQAQANLGTDGPKPSDGGPTRPRSNPPSPEPHDSQGSSGAARPSSNPPGSHGSGVSRGPGGQTGPDAPSSRHDLSTGTNHADSPDSTVGNRPRSGTEPLPDPEEVRHVRPEDPANVDLDHDLRRKDPNTGNQPDGSWDGQKGQHLNPSDNAAVQAFAADAVRAADNITPQLEASVTRAAPDARLVGLADRVKFPDSLKGKISTSMQVDGLPLDRALSRIDDSVRYTVEASPTSYARLVDSVVIDLKAQGMELTRFKNTWGSDGYKGINTTWRDPSTGVLFELQFHTPESFYTKTVSHDIYERLRLPGLPRAERETLEAENAKVFSGMEIPQDAVNLHYGP